MRVEKSQFINKSRLNKKNCCYNFVSRLIIKFLASENYYHFVKEMIPRCISIISRALFTIPNFAALELLKINIWP